MPEGIFEGAQETLWKISLFRGRPDYPNGGKMPEGIFEGGPGNVMENITLQGPPVSHSPRP